jgi:putative tricarboxylic transport membrane protein
MSGDFFQGLLWLFIGLAVVYFSSRYTIGTPSDPGPGALPFGLGLVLVLLSVILLFQSFRSKERQNEKHLPFGPKCLKVFAIILFLGLVTLTLESVGYLLSVFLMITVSMLIMEPRRWFSALFLGAIASYSSYLIFDVWLKVQLPEGLFHF